MRLRPLALAATVFAASILLAAKTQAGLSISVMTEDTTVGSSKGAIYTVDVATGKATLVSLKGVPGGNALNGTPNSIGFSNPDYFYTTGGNSGGSNFQTFFHYKTASGSTSSLALGSFAGGISGADAAGTTFYYFSDGNSTTKSSLGTVTGIFGAPALGSSVLSNVGNVSLGDLAINTKDVKKSYIAYQDKTNSKNYIGDIDLTTGVVSGLSYVGTGFANGAGRVNGLAFAGGKLYATTRDSNVAGGTQGAVYEVTGGSGTYALGAGVGISGLAAGYATTDAASVPEPATLAVVGLGSLCSMGLVRRFRRRAAQA